MSLRSTKVLQSSVDSVKIGDARIGQHTVLFQHATDGHVLLEGQDHRARRHNIADLHIAQAQQIGQDFVLALFQRPFAAADVGQGFEFQARHRGQLFSGREHPRQALEGQDNRIGEPDHVLDNVGEDGRQRLPVDCPQGLGDDLGEDENQQGDGDRHQTDQIIAKEQGSLGTSPNRPGSVGDGIEREDSCDRPVYVFFQTAHVLPGASPFLHHQFDMGQSDRKENRFTHGAQKGNT